MSRQRLGLAAVGLAVLVVAIHQPAWRGGFVYDDITEIAENPGIRQLWPPWVAMWEGTPVPHRPLPYYSFALNYAVGGLDPRGYRAVNLAIHLLNGLLGFVVCRRLAVRLAGQTVTPARLQQAAPLALAAVALWLVHPLGTQAVDYIYQRIEALAAMCMLATVACFLRATDGGGRGWLTASVAASAAGMCCKEHVAAVPVVVLLIDWLAAADRPGPRWRDLPAVLGHRRGYYAALFATPLLAVGLVLAQRNRFTELSQPLAGPLLYAANQPLVIGRYLWRVIWPADLCLDWYLWPVTNGLRLAGGIVAAVSVAMLGCLAISRSRGVALAVFSFAALLAPTSSFLPVNNLMDEHRMYLPLLVCCCAAACGLSSAAKGWVGGSGRLIGAGAVLVAVVSLAAVTWSRCQAYSSRLVMWADVVEKAPWNPRGWQTLALEFWQVGETEAALKAVDRSLEITPTAEVALLTRAGILCDLGRYDDAIDAAEIVIAMEPQLADAYQVLKRAKAGLSSSHQQPLD